MVIGNLRSLFANDEFDANMSKLEWGIDHLHSQFLNSKLFEVDRDKYIKMQHTFDTVNRTLMDVKQFLRTFDELVKHTAMEKLLNEGEEECPQQTKFNN